ncbi:MAG: hypothetical protein ABFC24_09520 [Methanoregulaceae archaeon]
MVLPMTAKSLDWLMLLLVVLIVFSVAILVGLSFATTQKDTGTPGTACSGAGITNSVYSGFLSSDGCYFKTHSPPEYLNDLRKHPDISVTVLSVPPDWITKKDAEFLIRLIDSDDPASPVISPLSSYMPVNEKSTVGNEALFLLEGYRTGRYPPRLCSVGTFQPDRAGILAWWEAYGKRGFLDADSAIALVQDRYSDLREFPSEEFPVRTITTEKADDGWYVAFITEGSGVPITSARCYIVDDNRSVQEVAVVKHSLFVQTDEFSAQKCG